MKSRSLWLIIPVIAGLVIAFFYFTQSREPAVPEPVPAVSMPEEPAEEPPPVQMAPPAPEEETEPLPVLDSSDTAVREEATAVVGEALADRFLVRQAAVRKIVITVDNLPRDSVNMRVRAVPGLGGEFLVSERNDEITLDEANYARYEPFVSMVTSIDAENFAELYVRYYPLLQQAYEELGYPSQQFHDRLMEVIAHLLATPEVKGPIRLVRPHVLYKYADPELEARSVGQKAMIRMGPANASTIKAKLSELERALEARAEPLTES